jgi:hypothetical protein
LIALASIDGRPLQKPCAVAVWMPSHLSRAGGSFQTQPKTPQHVQECLDGRSAGVDELLCRFEVDAIFTCFVHDLKVAQLLDEAVYAGDD